MVAPEWGTFKIGATTYPVGLGGVSNLAKQDAPIYWLLDYFTNMLNTYAGDAWAEAVAATNLATSCPTIVGYSLPYNPLPYIQTISTPFPLMALYRVSGKSVDKTVSKQSTLTQLELQYFLPPVSASQLEILNPFLNTVFQIIKDRSQQHFDPNYLDGYEYGAAAGYEEIISHVDYDMIYTEKQQPSGSHLMLPGIVIKLQMKEINEAVPDQFDEIEVISLEMDLINDPNDTPPDILEDFIDSELPPSPI